MKARVRCWSAWAPGLEDDDAWRAWCANPAPIKSEGVPEARFLPAMLRRRCTPLSRIVLTAAFGCCRAEELPAVRTLFASRHGSINESIDMLERLARREKLSPAKFSHTVHNAQAGLFSIAAENRRASSSLSAMEDTFGCAWLEALTHLDREPERPVLLVMGDVPLADTFAHLIDEPGGAYALGLLLARDGEGETVEFATGAQARPRPAPPWPEALEFLRFWLSAAPSLTLGSGRRSWHWHR